MDLKKPKLVAANANPRLSLYKAMVTKKGEPWPEF
jgi:hypothetical protein